MALQPEVELSTDEQKVSYGFGLQFGEQLRSNHFEGMDLRAGLAGVQHHYNEQQAALTGEQMNPAYAAVQEKQQAKAAEMDVKRQYRM